MDEWELLRRYAQDGSQGAFAELVRRHLDFVYSSARRQVGSPQLAQDVAQAVFLELARQAATLEAGTPLMAWLHLVTRRTALNARRTELRRQAREHAAYELSVMSTAPSVWSQLEPLLDEALETLNSDDRSALLLRFFENKPLRAVGAALGTSEDAAQKRLARALDHLRVYFGKQGVAVSAAALATHLSTHAVEAAPVALGGLISSATSALAANAATATPALSAAVATEATGTLAMTTLQKSLLVAALVAFGASVFELRALAGQRDLIGDLEREGAALSARQLAAQLERDAARTRLAAYEAEAARTTASLQASPARESAIAAIVARATRLKERLAAEPGLSIPEMALVQEEDWVQVARERAFDTEADLRASLGRIRSVAKGKLTAQLIPALSAYVYANNGRLPATAQELQPHVKVPLAPPVLAATLGRYRIGVQGSITDVPHGAVLIIENESSLVDPDYDSQVRITRMATAPDPDPLKINSASIPMPGARVPQWKSYLR